MNPNDETMYRLIGYRRPWSILTWISVVLMIVGMITGTLLLRLALGLLLILMVIARVANTGSIQLRSQDFVIRGPYWVRVPYVLVRDSEIAGDALFRINLEDKIFAVVIAGLPLLLRKDSFVLHLSETDALDLQQRLGVLRAQ